MSRSACLAFLAVLGLGACAERLFDNPFDPDNPFSAFQTITSYDTQAQRPAGLAFGREVLYLADALGARIHHINPLSGSQDAAIALPSGSAFGVAYENGFLWLSVPALNSIVRISPASGEPLQAPLPAPGGDPRGLAFDGQLLWLLDAATRSLYRIDPLAGPLGDPIPVPSIADPGGLTFRGPELWAVDQRDSRLVWLSANGAQIAAYQLPSGGAVGVASDGTSFYYSDRSRRVHVVRLRP
jgi:streptogramin lyase